MPLTNTYRQINIKISLNFMKNSKSNEAGTGFWNYCAILFPRYSEILHLTPSYTSATTFMAWQKNWGTYFLKVTYNTFALLDLD